ncbi:glycoside hydrolase family 25 protein [Streptomyces sp. NPDC007063]|uniref:glycoside hydrolase family 25 protein n=1 Tax=Streptomyces sp. NPDC007063 TaxID=3364772 RepID=UPI0036A8863A
MIYGVDVSSYQTETIPSKANGKRVDFAIIKATEGTGYVNPKMRAQAADARRKGLVVGFYHFVRPGDMAAQARYFAEKCDSEGSDLLVLDWEDNGVSNGDKNTFLAELAKLRGDTHKIGLYCNTSFWLNKDKGSKCGDFLWVAHYGVSAGKPGIRDPWVIHQYTDKTIDTNIADFSSREAMRKWATGSSKAKPSGGASQAARVLAILKAENGYREGANNKQKYSPAVPSLEWSQNQPWCQTFQSWGALRAGTASIEPRTASCRVACDWFKARGRFSEYPAIGAQVFFGPGGGTHVGRVYAYDATYAYTVEGNTNSNGSANGDGVYLRKRARRDSYLHGYGMPAFAEGVTTADPKLKGKPGYTYRTTATAPATTVSTVESELESMNKNDAYKLMWTGDYAPAPSTSSTKDTNKTWQPVSVLVGAYERSDMALDEVRELRKEVAELRESVSRLDLSGLVSSLESLRLRIDVQE